MIGWVFLLIVIELYLWAIDPPWLRTVWAFLCAAIATYLELIRIGVECVIALIRLLPNALYLLIHDPDR